MMMKMRTMNLKYRYELKIYVFFNFTYHNINTALLIEILQEYCVTYFREPKEKIPWIRTLPEVGIIR